MYSDASIQALVDSIGWSALALPTSRVLSAENAESTSGMEFSTYHNLAIPEVIEEIMPISNADTATVSITNDVLNAYLYKLKQQAARMALRKVFVTNRFAAYNGTATCENSIATKDWSDVIIARLGTLQDIYGLSMASIVVDLAINTTRTNYRQRKGYDSVQLKVEQDGYTDANGVIVAKGLTAKMAEALGIINKVLFCHANPRTVIRSASHLW